MEPTAPLPSWPASIHQRLKAANIKQVSFVPDGGHRELIQLCADDPAMRTISLTTEQEGIGLAAGAWLGGQRSVVLMQSSGVGNCVNALTLVRNCQFPFLMLVTMRGDFGESNNWQMAMGQGTEPILTQCGLVCQRVADPADVAETVDAALTMAFNAMQGVAVLISQRLVGAKVFK